MDGGAPRRLASEVQGLEKLLVPLRIGPVQVVEKLAAPRDKAQQPAARREVLFVVGHVTGEVVDPLGQLGDLDVGASGVLVMA